MTSIPKWLAQIAGICVALSIQPCPAASNDAGAGSWQMIVLSGPAQVPVPPPVATTDAAYQSELAAIKLAQANITSQQRQTLDYWNKGAVVCWNRILLDLVARMDLPPEPNDDGTYSLPSAGAPFAFPQFPFGLDSCY